MEKNLKELYEKVKRKAKEIKDLKKLILLGVIGMMLVLLPGFLPDKKSVKEENADEKYQVSEYAENLERKVEKILAEIDGVGNVSVMLTVAGTEEYIYAQENKESISSDSERNSSQNENSYIFEQKDGDKKALVKKVENPDVTGVVVVCDGGNSSSVKEQIYEAVSVVLNVPSNRIFVASTEKK